MKNGTRLAIMMFTLVAIAHLLRIIYGIPVTIGEWFVPQWVSLCAIVVPALITTMLWRESR